MTEGLENTRSENNQVSPPPLPCSVALRGVSVFIREYRENAYETRGLTLTAKNLMKSFQPFSSETIVSSVSLLYIASQRPVRRAIPKNFLLNPYILKWSNYNIK